MTGVLRFFWIRIRRGDDEISGSDVNSGARVFSTLSLFFWIPACAGMTRFFALVWFHEA